VPRRVRHSAACRRAANRWLASLLRLAREGPQSRCRPRRRHGPALRVMVRRRAGLSASPLDRRTAAIGSGSLRETRSSGSSNGGMGSSTVIPDSNSVDQGTAMTSRTMRRGGGPHTPLGPTSHPADRGPGQADLRPSPPLHHRRLRHRFRERTGCADGTSELPLNLAGPNRQHDPEGRRSARMTLRER
jgi:hypothetical protein